MRTIRRQIALVGFAWLIAVAGLTLIIPLHFFSKLHQPAVKTSESTSASCPVGGHSCKICAFDLYPMLASTPVILSNRIETLLAVLETSGYGFIPVRTPLYLALRGPPFA